jgi:hypothetical protein
MKGALRIGVLGTRREGAANVGTKCVYHGKNRGVVASTKGTKYASETAAGPKRNSTRTKRERSEERIFFFSRLFFSFIPVLRYSVFVFVFAKQEKGVGCVARLDCEGVHVILGEIDKQRRRLTAFYCRVLHLPQRQPIGP